MAQSDSQNARLSNHKDEVIKKLKNREQELLKKLRINESLNAKILDALPFTIFLEDPEGRVVFANKHASNFFGVTLEEMVDRKKYDLFSPAMADRIRQDDLNVWRNKTLVTQEEEVVFQGKPSFVFTGKTIIRTEEESSEEFLLGFAIDISARVQAEQLLKESEERFRRLMDQAADSFFLIDMNGRIVDVNLQACKSLGYTRDNLLSMHLDVICSLSAAERQVLMDRVATGETVSLEDWMIRYDGTHVPNDVRLGLIRFQDQDMILALVRDITGRKIAEEKIRHMAYHDALTDLPNRRFIMERSRELLNACTQTSTSLALMILDLDHFKVINDSLGHQSGDRLLQLVAHRLQSCISETDTLARMGGDEFIVLVPNYITAEKVITLSETIIRAMEAPFYLDDQMVTTSTSIGISVYPNDASDIHTLLKHADISLYQSKKQGRNGYQIFQASMLDSANQRLQVETLIRQALEHNHLFVQYQPIIDLKTGRVFGFEALIRCRDEFGQTVAPCTFIPVAEETGLIIPIEEWILREACLRCREWNAAGLGPLCVSINISARQFQSRDLEQRVSKVLQETGIPPHLLDLELTESTLMQNPAQAAKILVNLKKLGVRLSIDDFGTGFSSLSYLMHFPLDTLKIDRSFIGEISSVAAHSAISAAIISLAHSLNLRVIAEGVETEEQLHFLNSHHCDAVQGFYFSRPLDEERIPGFLGGVRLSQQSDSQRQLFKNKYYNDQ